MPFTDPHARMAHARASMATKYLEEARAQFDRMGITPTRDQLSTSGDALMKAAQRERMNVARHNRWTSRDDAKRDGDRVWATHRALAYADKLLGSDPSTDADAFRAVLMAVADELSSPDGLNRPRLIKRLDAHLRSVMAHAPGFDEGLTSLGS